MDRAVKGYDEFRHGWPVVLSSMLGIGLGLSPLPFYTASLMAPELKRAFGWDFAQILLLFPITTISVVLMGPLVGLLIDRIGVRLVTLISVPAFGLSFMAFSLSNGSLTLFYANWALAACLGAGTLPITWTRAVNNWFEVRKGLALGLCLMGTGVFGYIVTPLTAWLIDSFGWRIAYAALGALPLTIAWPVALLCFRDIPAARGSVDARRAYEIERRAVTAGLTPREAFTDWRFWVLAAAILPVSFAVGGPIPNAVNILTIAGFSRAEVVQLASLIGLFVVIGRITGGWVLDRFWAPGVAFLLFLGPATAYWLLSSGSYSYPVAALSIGLMGFGAGIEYDVVAFLTARYFGMKSYGVIYGAFYAVFAIGAASGPVYFGAVFDATHSYGSALALSSGLMLLGAVILLGLGRYRVFPAVAEAVAA